MVGAGEKKFLMKALGWLENAALGLVFANTVFYKSTVLLIFEEKFIESVEQALISRVYYKDHLGCARRKIFLIKVLRWLENAVLRLVFANSMFYKRDILLTFAAEFAVRVV